MSPVRKTSTSPRAPSDLAARLAEAQPVLRKALGLPDTWSTLGRRILAQSEPVGIARVLMDVLAGWIPAPAWAVVVAEGQGQLAFLAAAGVPETHNPALLTVASFVLQQGELFVARDLAGDARVADAPAGAVVGLPLTAGGRAIGAVLALDPAPSARVPAVPAATLAALKELLETAALAMEHVLRLQRAEAMSVTDHLTGLYNARFLQEALHREAKRAMRYGRPVSVLFVDLDGFKTVNDTYGHLAGSRTLVEAGAVIRASARESDIVARYGGDEFVVVLPDTGSEGGLVVGRRVRDRIALQPFLSDDGIACRLTASVGVAALPDAARSSEELLDAADRAMYHVKQTGKNNICLASRL